jgi:hypothetical protein
MTRRARSFKAAICGDGVPAERSAEMTEPFAATLSAAAVASTLSR